MLTDYGKSYYLQALLGQVPVPATYYVALLTSTSIDATIDGTSLASYEVASTVGASSTGYVRTSVAATNFTVSAGIASLSAAISFPTPATDWGYVVAFALCDASTAGHVYAWSSLDAAYTVLAGQAVSINPGGLVFSLDAINSLAS